MADGVRRGEIWTIAGGAAYVGKPRPAVVVQDDVFEDTESITVCPITTVVHDAPLIRITVDPSSNNGLQRSSQLMIDKITTVPRGRMGRRIGHLADPDVVRLNAALFVFLGLGRRPTA